MTETEILTRICKDSECRIEFIPQYRGTLLISPYCPDCRYKQAHALRVQRLNVSRIKYVESSNLPLKQVVRINRTGEISKKKDTLSLIEKNKGVKLINRTIPQLLKLAEIQFNLFVRNRDRLPGNRFYCPTCDREKPIEGRDMQACHCFPAGLFPELRFNENNVFSGCLQCNFFKHGTSYIYNDWVRKHIGEAEYSKLILIKDYAKNHGFKWDKFTIIEIIETYKARNKAFGKPDPTNILEGNIF